MRHFIGNEYERFSGCDPYQCQTEQNQQDTFCITSHRSQHRSCVFQTTVHQSMKDIYCHRSFSDIRIGFFLCRKHQHEQINQYKRQHITSATDQHPLHRIQPESCIRISAIKNLHRKLMMIVIHKQSYDQHCKNSQRPTVSCRLSESFQHTAVKFHPRHKKRKKKRILGMDR